MANGFEVDEKWNAAFYDNAVPTSASGDPSVAESYGSPHGLMSRTEVAEFLSVSLATVERLYRSGELPSVKLGRLRRVRREDLERFVAQGIKAVPRVVPDAQKPIPVVAVVLREVLDELRAIHETLRGDRDNSARRSD
jgi:excisionase family DNA binding protein